MSRSRYDTARATVVNLNRLIRHSTRRLKTEEHIDFKEDRQTARSIFFDPNILGFGIGSKLATKKRIESELCLVFFVRKKLPKSRLRHGIMIPPRFALKRVGRSIQTDVLEWEGIPTAHGLVRAGSSIGDTGGNAGTMTLAVTENDTGNLLMLGCSHVLARCGQGQVGDPIESPANLDASPNIVGSLQRFTTIDPATTDNAVDAAVAFPEQGVTLSNNITGIGTPAGIRDLTSEGDPIVDQLVVRRAGVASGPQTGTIRYIHVSTPIDYPQLNGDPSVYFTELVQYDAVSREGDSGAAVVDDSVGHSVVGMHIAGSNNGSASFFTHIQYVLTSMACTYGG
jgi:hypothetical protein